MNSESSVQVSWWQMNKTMKPLEVRKAMHILRVVLLSKNVKSLSQATVLHLRVQRKSLITICENMQNPFWMV